jgi:uncharacterized protein DUF5309
MASGALFQTYDFGFAAGSSNREDLLDVIVNIAPYETPFFSTAPKTTTKHTTHEWLEDTLTAASGNPYAYVEGQDFSAAAIANRSRKSNITQIFRKDINVSETQRAVNPAGVKDEYAYQVGIALKEIARHIETRIFASAASATGASGTSRLMKPLEGFITTNTASAASGSATRATLDLLIENTFLAGGNPDRLYVTPNVKSAYATVLAGTGSTGAGNYRNIAAMDSRVTANIDVYQSNFNLIQLVPDRFIPGASATTVYGRNWLIESPKARIAFLRPIKSVPLAPAGDSTRGMVLGELTLELMAETAHGKIINQVTA